MNFLLLLLVNNSSDFHVNHHPRTSEQHFNRTRNAYEKVEEERIRKTLLCHKKYSSRRKKSRQEKIGVTCQMSHPCLPLEIIDPFLNVSIEKNIKKIEKSREKPDIEYIENYLKIILNLLILYKDNKLICIKFCVLYDFFPSFPIFKYQNISSHSKYRNIRYVNVSQTNSRIYAIGYKMSTRFFSR